METHRLLYALWQGKAFHKGPHRWTYIFITECFRSALFGWWYTYGALCKHRVPHGPYGALQGPPYHAYFFVKDMCRSVSFQILIYRVPYGNWYGANTAQWGVQGLPQTCLYLCKGPVQVYIFLAIYLWGAIWTPIGCHMGPMGLYKAQTETCL